MYSVAQQQQQNYSFQRFESDRIVEDQKPKRVVHAQFNSPINLYSKEKIAETLNEVLTQDSYQTVSSGSSPSGAYQWVPDKDKYEMSLQSVDPRRKAPLPPPKPKPGVQFQPHSVDNFSRQDSSPKAYVDSAKHQQPFGNKKTFGTSYRQSSQEIVEEYTEDYSNEGYKYHQPQVSSSQTFGVRPGNSIYVENSGDNSVFEVNKMEAKPKKDTRVFAANYKPYEVASPAVSNISAAEKKHFEASDETIEQRNYYEKEVQRQEMQRQQMQRQQVDERNKQFEEQQRRNLKSEHRRLEEERQSQGSPYESDGEPKLNLHQGSVVQFLSKLPDPKYKLPDGSHLGEEKHMIRSHQGTVCQFATHIPDPNQKLIEGSHLREEREQVHLHGGTVQQFPTNVPDYSQKLPEAPHMKDLEDLEHLHLKQGSVVQFPKEIRETKMNGFHPPREVMEEALPPAESVKYNQLLPSEARKQQAYLVHPTAHPVKLLSEVCSAPGSPSAGRRNNQWPPRTSSHDRSNHFIIPEVGRKTFLWPPPKPEHHRSFQELPPPDDSHGHAGDLWNPQESKSSRSYRQPVITRKKAIWPPPAPRLIKQSSLPESGSGRRIEFDEHFLYHAGCNIPACYRPPPGTQFYNPYEEQ